VILKWETKNCAGGLEHKHVHSINDNGWLENMYSERLNNLYSSCHVIRAIGLDGGKRGR
jgi:hypothetical protein